MDGSGLRHTARRGNLAWLLPMLLLLSLPACVYFNTFYNASKYFAQAEKARRRERHEAFAQQTEASKGLGPETKRLYDKAAKKASRVLEKYPESDRVDDALFLLGQAFYWQQDYLSAERSFNELESNIPDSEFYQKARYFRALSMEGQGQADEARALYQSLVTGADPEVAAQAGLRLGEMAYAAGSYTAAIQEYQSTLEAFPHSSQAARLRLRLGETLVALEDSTRDAQALQVFDSVLEAHPSTELEYQARLNKGRLFYRNGDVEAALGIYMELLGEGRFRASEGQTRLRIGRYYQDQRQLSAALDQYEQVRDDFPGTPASAMALYQTGLLYLRDQGEEERAREYLDEVGRENRNSEAATLAREMLRYLNEASRLRDRVARADSVALAGLAADGAGQVAAAVTVDSLAQAEGDSVILEAAVELETGAGVVGPSLESATGSRADTSIAASAAPVPMAICSQDPAVLDDLLGLAELYRDPLQIAVPDSARRYFREVQRRFPEFAQMPRILYSLAWTYLEEDRDEAAARPILEELVEAYPASRHANAAREQLGLMTLETAEKEAAVEFQRVESLRLRSPGDYATYLPLLDSLSVRSADPEIGAKAAYVAAYVTENTAKDSSSAATRYADLQSRFPRTRYGRLAAARDSVRREGLIAKLERGLKSVGGQLPPGERITVLCAEPDSMDSLAWARKYHALGMRAQRRGDLHRARSNYESSLDERQRQPEVLYQLGNVLREQGYIGDALERYQQALRLRPSMLEVQYGLLAAHTQEGREDSASHYLRGIMQRDSRNPQIELLREQFPELAERNSREELDLRVLEELDIVAPDVSLYPSFDGLLSELPVVRHAELPPPVDSPADTARVILDVMVDVEGDVADVKVFSGPEDRYQAATAAAWQYTFFPALDRRGEGVVVWVELEVPFLWAADGGASGTARDAATRRDTVSASNGE